MELGYSYMVGMFLWSVLGGLILFYGLKRLIQIQRMPPGPYFLPLIGAIMHFGSRNVNDEFKKYKKKYGRVFSFSAGDFYIIVINGYKTIQEVLKKEVFQGRPDFEMWKRRNFGHKNRGILFNDGGPVWQEQRRFALRSLRDFGFGKESMGGLLAYEMEVLVNHLRKDIGKPISLSGGFNSSVLNSLWYILTGKRYELDDPDFGEAISLLNSSIQSSKLISIGLFWSFPVTSNLIARKRYALALQMRQKLRALIKKIVDEHFETYQEGETRDFMDSYIEQMQKSDKTSSFYEEEGKLNLQVVLLDLFVAGAETTSTTLLWSILYLTQHLDIQRKVQAEIDSVIGKERPPTRDDKDKMVYLEAFLNEVHRICSLLPMSVFHKVLEDTELEGYLLPKGSVVFVNMYDAHHDEKYWKDPEVFRPERFLDPTGTHLVKHDALMPFSYGKRQCLGESLARDTLFIFLTGLLQNFNFEIDPAMKTVELKADPQFVTSPNPYKVVISSRV